MLYFAYLPKTTIADIIPVLTASFDSNFIKPCTPDIADDGTLYYTTHESYVIENSDHPLNFRSVDWSNKKDTLRKLSHQNVFVGNYKDHSKILQDIKHKTISVSYKPEYIPLLIKQAEMFNKHHSEEFKINNTELLPVYDFPKSNFNIDLLDLFSESLLVNFMEQVGTYNTVKHDFVLEWLDKLKKNTSFWNILLDISKN